MALLNAIMAFAETTSNNLGLVAIGAGLAVCFGTGSAIGEGLIVCHAIDGMARNPEAGSRLRSTMILGVALTESTAIYAFIVAILIVFVLGGKL